jgi:plastocyanin
MSRRWLLLVPILIAGCTSGIGRPVHEVTAHSDASGVQHVRVVTHTFYFEPNRIVLKAGQPVELTVKNGSWFVPHNLTCNAAGAGIQVMADVGFFGGSRHTRFTPTKPGEYEFFCHEDSHAKKGMKGTFVVVP